MTATEDKDPKLRALGWFFTVTFLISITALFCSVLTATPGWHLAGTIFAAPALVLGYYVLILLTKPFYKRRSRAAQENVRDALLSQAGSVLDLPAWMALEMGGPASTELAALELSEEQWECFAVLAEDFEGSVDDLAKHVHSLFEAPSSVRPVTS